MKSFICCPIVCVDDAIGVLAVDNVKTKRTLLQSDIDLLMALSPEIGISIQNAMVTDTKENSSMRCWRGRRRSGHRSRRKRCS